MPNPPFIHRLRPAAVLLACVCAFLLAAPAGLRAQDKSGKPDAAEPVEAVREPVGKILQAAQELHKSQKYAEAVAKLRDADLIADKTPFETYWVERLRGSAAVGAGDAAVAEKSFEHVLASGRIPAAERIQVMELLISAFQRARNHPKTVEWTGRYFKEGGKRADVRAAHINALYLTEDFVGTVRELQADLKALEAAGQVAQEIQWKLLGSAQARNKDEAGYAATLEKLVAHYPSKDYWADLIARTRARVQSPARLALDWYRLRQETAGLRSAAEFQHMAQLASDAGIAAEAVRVLDQGFAAGVLGVGVDASAHASQRVKAVKEAAEDAKLVAGGKTPWTQASNGIALLNYGYGFVLEGQLDRGFAMMEEGIAKGGLKNADDARLHLGVSYARAGRKDRALKALDDVKGADGAAEIARLWKLHLQRPAR